MSDPDSIITEAACGEAAEQEALEVRLTSGIGYREIPLALRLGFLIFIAAMMVYFVLGGYGPAH